MGTPFSAIYDRFIGKITDDMYVELTPEDTYRDLQNLLIDALPGFEFPRCNLSNYQLKVIPKRKDDINEVEYFDEGLFGAAAGGISGVALALILSSLSTAFKV